MEGDGGEEGALAAGQEAKPEADEEEGKEKGVGPMGEGEEGGGEEGGGAAGEGLEEGATVEELFRKGAKSADEGEQGEGLHGGECPDQADGALGGAIGGDGNEGPRPGDQADGVADEGAQTEGRCVRRAPGDYIAEAGTSAGEEPGEDGQEEEREADGLRKE